MIPEDKIAELEKLAQKNEAVAELLEFYRTAIESPYYDTYITLYSQIQDWNDQLTIKPEREIIVDNDGIKETGKVTPGKIDLFADKDSKEFERVFKYFSDIVSILNALDAIRLKLTPQQQEDIKKNQQLKKMGNQVAI